MEVTCLSLQCLKGWRALGGEGASPKSCWWCQEPAQPGGMNESPAHSFPVLLLCQRETELPPRCCCCKLVWQGRRAKVGIQQQEEPSAVFVKPHTPELCARLLIVIIMSRQQVASSFVRSS